MLNWVISDPTRAYQLEKEIITGYEVKSMDKPYNYFVEKYGATPCERPELGVYIVVRTPTMSENVVIGFETCDFDINNGEYRYQFFRMQNIV